jgi:hypothetical protein
LFMVTDVQKRAVENTFQIGLVNPGYVWGGNPHKVKRDTYYSDDDDECNICHHKPPPCQQDTVPCQWKPCPPKCPKPATPRLIPPTFGNPFPKPSPTPYVCDECWWQPPCAPPCDYTPCPEECPAPEPICEHCQWESPCEESDSSSSSSDECEWVPCPEICLPPQPEACDSCHHESPCESDEEPCEWTPCPQWCPPPPPKVTQIWDGQIQAPCHSNGYCPPAPVPAPAPAPAPVPKPCQPHGNCPVPPSKVTQIWDGQIQAPVYAPQKPSPPKVTQIWDGQVQAPPQYGYNRFIKRGGSKNY